MDHRLIMWICSLGFVLLLLTQTVAAVEVSYNISLLVGGGNQYGDGLPADKINLYNPTAIAFNSRGDMYVVDAQLQVIRKIAKDGITTTIAGFPQDAGYNGDNILANKAKLNYPRGVAVNENDEIFISDSGNYRIRKISNSGIISTVAGTGENGFMDHVLAINGKFGNPSHLLYTNSTLYINDQSNNKIRKLDFTTGSLSTVETYPLGKSSNGKDYYFANFAGVITKLDSNSGNSTKIGSELSPNLSSFIQYSSQLDCFFYSIYSDYKVYRQSLTGVVSTFAGSNENSGNIANFSGEGNLAVNATIGSPAGLLIRDGYLYVAMQTNSRIGRVELSSGIITTFAGVDANSMFEGVFGNATYLSDSSVRNMVFETESSVYFSESNKIRMIDKRTSLIRTIVKTSSAIECFTYFNNTLYLVINYATIYRVDSNNSSLHHFAGSLGTIVQNRPALGVQFMPKGISFNQKTGDLYVSDSLQHIISKITKNGQLSVIAGSVSNPGFSGDNQLAINSLLYSPQDIVVNSQSGEIFFVDASNQKIRKIDSNGIISTLISVSYPEHMEINPSTNELYIAYGCRIVKFSAVNGTMTGILAGTGAACAYNGDNIPAINAQIKVDGMTINSNGEVFFISEGSRIRKIDSNGIISTIAGTGTLGYNGDNIPAVTSQLNNPTGIAISPTTGEVFISDTTNLRIRKIDSKGIISTIAGTGTLGYNGENVVATNADLYHPSGLSFFNGELYFVAYDRIRKVSTENLVSTIAGGDGDGGPAQYSNLEQVRFMTMSNLGEMFMATGNRIRKISTTGIISTVAGMIYNFGYNGDRKIATTAHLWNPIGISLNSEGEVYIADLSNHRIRKVSKSGIISTIAGLGAAGYIDNVLATESQLNAPKGVVVAPSGEVFIADSNNNKVRKISTSGIISTIAGGGSIGLTAETQLATLTKLTEPSSVNVNSNGEVLIFDRNSIRKLLPLAITCFGKFDSEACSGKGKCISYDKCACSIESGSSTYYGPICEKFDCNGKPMNESGVCSGRGKCLSPNSCSCLDGFYGSNCENSLVTPGTSRQVATSEKTIGQDNTLVIVLAIIIPIIFIALIVVIVLVIVAVVFFKRKQTKAGKSGYQTKANTELETFTIPDFPSEGSLFLQPLMSISSTGKKEEPFNPLSRYSNLEKVGQGSFGNVFKAFDEKTKTTKAIKVIKYSNIDELNNFMREGAQLMNVNHPNILKVNEFFIGQDQMLCIDTDFYEKGDLVRLTNIDFDCSEKLLKEIIHQTCKALDYIHCTMNVIHRDIKPSNIFIKSLENDSIHLIIADFGLAKSNMASVMHSFAGTPLFMSPELGFGGKYYHNTDVYSLGVTLYQIMTKDTVTSISQLYVSKDQETVTQILRKKMKEAELYSDKVINIVLSMLSKDSVTRPQAQDILNDPYFR
ncbi:predicted protein [Naegleria gruberi]|uniref:Predicted protein n=1 Tax=Naegleria gruberi TaxID=5762 RepID=D2V8Z5_NAEGR|nr:uncharacterized protein NAEGRDRAFT_65336 [Naegleria gruberi]EFC46776.1 predicted protein [Naegleria gruberi]|eukprot:XP_002679520.1 predicted protein [Naegleria gruberi strain NEG-M]